MKWDEKDLEKTHIIFKNAHVLAILSEPGAYRIDYKDGRSEQITVTDERMVIPIADVLRTFRL